MDYVRRTSRIKSEVSSLKESYPHDLQLYRTPPMGDITLNEFQELALERMKVLRTIESVYLQTDIDSEKRLATVLSELRKDNSLLYYVKLIQGTGNDLNVEADLKARRKDHISHYILQLAHCTSEDLKKWYIAREVELFKLRFGNLSPEGVRHFLKINTLNYVPISKNEKEDIKEYLSQSTTACSDAYVEVHDFYKVPFYEVTDLIKNRRVYLKASFAYIPERDLISVFVTLLKMQLASALAFTKRGLPILNTDDRISILLGSLHNTYTGSDFTDTDCANIPIESLDTLSKISYPLCMRFMHETLRAKHHLKHDGRQQYGLFLKGIGVLFEDAVCFWRDEFCKMMELDKFEKDYLYNIKHNFGKVGRRVNYTPYSCLKIIQSSVGPDQVHGCPFKETDVKILKQRMLSYGINSAAVQDIANLAENHHYQIACNKYFEASHKCASLNAVVHPNGYFRDSLTILNGGKTATVSGQMTTNEKTRVEKIQQDLIDGNDDMDAALSSVLL